MTLANPVDVRFITALADPHAAIRAFPRDAIRAAVTNAGMGDNVVTVLCRDNGINDEARAGEVVPCDGCPLPMSGWIRKLLVTK